VAVAAYGSALVRQGHLSAGQLASFTLYSGLAGMGLAGLLRAAATDWQTPAWRLLCVAQAEAGEPAAAAVLGPPAARSSSCRGHVQFDGVHFAYATRADRGAPAGNQVLSGVDLEVTIQYYRK
jgi:ABC-type multidrug transport system fused ATPase/permease subunit